MIIDKRRRNERSTSTQKQKYACSNNGHIKPAINSYLFIGDPSHCGVCLFDSPLYVGAVILLTTRLFTWPFKNGADQELGLYMNKTPSNPSGRGAVGDAGGGVGGDAETTQAVVDQHVTFICRERFKLGNYKS